jgi:hypothetical protein
VYNYGNDIGLALETLELVDMIAWKPKMEISKEATDKTLEALENKQ